MSESSTEIYSKLGTLQQSLEDVLRRLDQIQEELNSTRSEVSSDSARLQSLLLTAEDQLKRDAESRIRIVSKANEAIQKLSLGTSQDEILDLFLQEVEPYVDRAILFLHKEDGYAPWKSIGFEAKSIEGILAEDPDDPIVKSARRQRIIYRSDSTVDAFPWLQGAGDPPGSAICVPLVFHDFVPVVLYGDASGSLALDELELLTHLTVLVLKNNFLQGLVSGEAEAATGAQAAVPLQEVMEEEFLPEEGIAEAATAIETAPGEAEAPEISEPEAGEEEAVGAETIHYEETPAEVGSAVTGTEEILMPREEPPAWQDFGEAGTEAEAPIDEIQPVAEEEPAPTLGFKPAEPELTSVEELAPGEDQWAPIPAMELLEETIQEEPEEEAPHLHDFPETIEQPSIEPEVVSTLSDEEQRMHNDARRFARLLVSEIKLYNENQVLQGRQSADLYVRLARDVDRSWAMYHKRAHPSVRTSKDYFHEELIRIVAGGDESLLGEDYPGPRLEA